MANENNTSRRASRLQTFLKGVLSGERQVANSRDAGLFLEALYSHKRPSSCIERVVASDYGVTAIQLAVRVDLSLTFLASRTLPFLRYLSDPGITALVNGEPLRKILTAIARPITLWEKLMQHFKAGEFPPEHLYAFAWLALELVLHHEIGETDAAVVANHRQIEEASEHDVRELGYRIRHALDLRGNSNQSPQGQAEGPGGRHDNDHADFRKVRIYPTRDELLSKMQPYYLTASEVQQTEAAKRAHVHLDNQFRLLREDMLAELREDVQSAKKRGQGRVKSLTLGGLVPVDIDVGDTSASRFRQCSLAVQCFRGLEFLKRMDKDQRKKHIQDDIGFLRDQSFGALCHNDEVLAFASICRNVELLAQSPPIVTLRFTDATALKASLVSLHRGFGARSHIRFVLVDTPVFAYEPVLRRLQDIAEIPLCESLFGSVPSAQDVIPSSDALRKHIQMMQRSADSMPDNGTVRWRRKNDDVEVDHAQLTSILAGLARAISLIQGPPGTGKSFIGAEIARIIHDMSQQRILVLSYTNHALNQYLEDLMNAGIPPDSMTRLGSRTKCTDAILPLLLSQTSRGTKLSHNSWTNINRLKHEASELAEHVQDIFKEYNNISGCWKSISEFLEFSSEGNDFYEGLQTPVDSGDWKQIGQKGKEIGPSYLFDRWIKGKDAGVFKSAVQPGSHIWEMSKAVRWRHRDQWVGAILSETVDRFADLVSQFDRKVGEIDTYFREGDVRAVQQKRVMALTTTGAAKHTSLLKAFKPDIVIAEEAGEILESHILTAMTSTVRQLILIGDHKQLRPKVNNYCLSVEAGNGFDLNRSLFERLILRGMPHTVLRKQHRMAPELSCYARGLTYPELLDAPKTHDREKVRGLRGRVVFVHHESQEGGDVLSERRDPSSKGSKRNDFEAEMVMRCVKYMGQQGYSTSQLVILTPYLGQLRALSEVLRKNKHDPQMSELDRFELLRAGLMTHAETNIDKKPVRISTIDNYQGEESDIVIASLTRSNPHGDIGFMAAPERLNVLITRARHGMILFGNMQTFVCSKKGRAAWLPFFDMLKARGCLYDGLPVRCERHPERTALLKVPSDFAQMCPDGGCPERCPVMLACGIHSCTFRCHRVADHTNAECNHIVKTTCDRNHQTRVPCHKRGTRCHECVREDQETEKRIRRDLDLEIERQKRQAAYMKELTEIRDEIDHQRRTIRYVIEEDEQKKTISQHRADLEVLQKTHGNILARKQHISQSVDASPPFEDVSTGQAELDDAWCVGTAKGDWERMKALEGAQSTPLDTLMSMIGLEDVKKEFLAIKTKVDTSLRQGVPLTSERFSCTLLGNPGTGKTTVARLYASFLTSIGVIPGASFHETTGSSLANKGISGCRNLLDTILEDGGGVLFIDEAYQLTSGNNPGGSGVLDFLLAEVENNRGKIVFVLAGYSREMEGFFSHNPGIPSRFPTEIRFADYTDDELLSIFNKAIHQRFGGRMTCEGGHRGLYCRTVARRIGYGRGREGFGNARAVENIVDIVHKRQGSRLRRGRSSGEHPNDFILTKEDLIGPAPTDVLANCKAWEKLQGLLGLQAVKEAVQSLMDSIRENYQRELEEKPRIDFSLNKVFVGSPGTGKTTVAKLYGEILAALGLLSKGEVVVRNPADFIGSALGQSEQQTKGILAATVGKVLVIDEAYGLYGGSQGGTTDPYKTAVIDTIVAEVQSVPGDDRCVLLLGYRDQLETMFQSVNPGLSRRFPLAMAFTFDDFSSEELGQILDMKLKDQGYRVTGQARSVAMDILKRARNRPNFGNAGEVDIILSEAKQRSQARRSTTQSGSVDLLEAVDFDEYFDRVEQSETNIRKLFDSTIGCGALVDRLIGYQSTAKSVKALGLDPKNSIPFNFLFRGPPGTGKTTTARKMGKVFYDMGFLATAEVNECSATELVGQYVGQTGPKVQQVLDRALGRVLFVDEAYRLGDGTFSREAVDELVTCLTKDRYHKKLIVILAGYDDEVNRLMAINPGLSSRFPEAVDFRALSAAECIQLLQVALSRQQDQLKKNGVKLELAVLTRPTVEYVSKMMNLFSRLISQESWANARDVMTLAEGVFNRVVKWNTGTNMHSLVLKEAMVTDELCAMHEERQSRASSTRGPELIRPETMLVGQSPITYNRSQLTTTSSFAAAMRPHKEEEHLENSTTIYENHPVTSGGSMTRALHAETRDKGVSDAVWDQLERDKAAEAAKEERFQRLQSAARDARDAARDLILKKVRMEEDERRREEAIQEYLQVNGICPAGYHWIQQSNGFRCAGGSHFMANDQLNEMFK